MVNFYVTNQFYDIKNNLVEANKTITISEERAMNLCKKNCGYITGKAEVKEEVKTNNKNLIGKK